MKLIAFKVENYRSINDSGWVEIDDFSCIVGKNESGKTSLLQALWKFNPFKENRYSLDRDWPRGRRKEKNEEATVCTCRFSFSESERAMLSSLDESCKDITEVSIRKEYSGKTWYTFSPTHPPNQPELSRVVDVLGENLLPVSETASPHFNDSYSEALSSFIEQVRENGGSEYAVQKLPEFKGTIAAFRSPEAALQAADDLIIAELQKRVDVSIADLKVDPVRRAIDAVSEWLPTFIYMDDYRVFNGRAQLDQVKARFDAGKAQDADETIVMIMEQSGLDLEDEVEKGDQEDREQRMLDMNDASRTLTDEIADRWSQKRYEVMFQADGQHFVTFVKDDGATALVPLEERSKGFQWFFSFDMTFMCETNGQFDNAIILLDEPGLHLHASAQRDLLTRMYAYAECNQLLYSTHLPFMIDSTRLENIHICEESIAGSIVHRNWQNADKDARFTLQAALGLSWSQSLFVGQYNLVVEGVTDFWYLSAVSSIFVNANEDGIHDSIVITPAGGASKVAYVGTILLGQELDVCVLLDSDPAGDAAYEQLVHQWILDDKFALKLGEVLGVTSNIAIEDLFDPDYILEFASQAYSSELKGERIVLSKDDARPIVDKIETKLQEKGVEKFNKGRMAKLILRDLSAKSIEELGEVARANFGLVFSAVNSIHSSWVQDGDRDEENGG